MDSTQKRAPRIAIAKAERWAGADESEIDDDINYHAEIYDKTQKEMNDAHHIKDPKSNGTRKIVRAFALLILAAWVHNAVGFEAQDCLTRENMREIEANFFSRLPESRAFEGFTEIADFKLRTNTTVGYSLEEQDKSSEEKVVWLSHMFQTRPRLFDKLSHFNAPDFIFIKGALRGVTPSIYNNTSSKKFPIHECVYEVTYDIPPGACVMSQYVHDLSFTFIKEKGKVQLGSVELYLNSCKK